MRTWKDVATLVKTRNLNGRFVVRSTAGLPFLLDLGMSVHFVPPQTDLPRSGTVCFMKELADESFEVEFDTVTDAETAHGLVGCHCLVRRELLDEEDLADDSAFWRGWTLVDTQGATIGEVIDIEENPAHPLLVVKRANDGNLAYVPAVEDFIVEVDDSESIVVVDVPTGLLDLYKSE